MAAVSEFLTGKGRHALAYDVRGRGDSSPADVPSTILRHARDAAEIIDSLPAGRVLILGYSMGAFIGAMAAGLSAKVAGLVMFDGGGLLTKADADKLIPALARMDKVFAQAEDYVEAVKPNYAGLGLPWNGYIEAAVRHEVGLQADGRYKYKGQGDRVKEDLLDVVAFKHEEVFARVACPVLLVHARGGLGQGAPLYGEDSYAATRACLPNLTFYQTKANHYTMMLEQQPELNEQLEAFASTCGF
jgi:pimeloyl-ACP methyl ester carboxylesterase